MNVSKTIKCFRDQEKQAGELLLDAVCRSNKKNTHMHRMLIRGNPLYLSAVNTKARIKWGTLLIRELFEFFNIPKTASEPQTPVFFVTLADSLLITTAESQKIDLELFKRKLAARLRGLDYIGMIEPAYYYNSFDTAGQKTPDLVSWHGHFLVWRINRKRLSRIVKKVNCKLKAVMPEFAAAHWKQVERGKFGQKICYLAKSPRKEYSVGEYKVCKQNGEPHYKHNRRDIRPGTRAKLFHLLRHLYLDQLAMAGGHGCELLRKIKYEVLRDYRARKGWNDRRP